MTCIVGIIQNKAAYIGADSAGVSGLDVTIRKDTKVFKVGDFIIGCTSSFRMIQLLRYSLSPPVKHDDVDIYQYMCTDFINAVRACLKNGGYAETERGADVGGTFLVAWKDRLFKIQSDYQVGEPIDQHDSCGCGQSYAMSTIDIIQKLQPEMDPEAKLKMALENAAFRSGGVRPPFIIENNAS